MNTQIHDESGLCTGDTSDLLPIIKFDPFGMRVIVAGSRTFGNYTDLKNKLNLIFNFWQNYNITIISGGAKGADALGERYAKERGYKLEIYPAKWDKYGKSAGYKRNEQMAGIATHCIVFQVDNSRGSNHMCNIALEFGLPLHRFYYSYTNRLDTTVKEKNNDAS